ncbi:MAG TPA: glycosyltransferase family 2 protein [Candidatus Acidoferrales bacterium]|nr:glycosyltransferase family 2 protein [Candidatus Acidoferrales bacterium]
MESKSETIAAVVVTYNRKLLLKECLEGILAQNRPVQGIVIIDNASIDRTPEMLKDLGFLENVPTDGGQEPGVNRTVRALANGGKDVALHYVRLSTNAGSSGGFYEGVKRAYNMGFDRLWIMDDDCLPQETCLAELLENLSPREYGGPIRFTRDGVPLTALKKVYAEVGHRVESLTFAFNGLLMPRRIVAEIGFPLKGFFISFDDTEYCKRARDHDFKGYYIRTAKLYHPDAPHFDLRFAGLKITVPNYTKGDRIFYAARNVMYTYRLHKKHNRLRGVIKVYGYEILALFFKEFSLRRLRLLVKGVATGVFTKPVTNDECRS